MYDPNDPDQEQDGNSLGDFEESIDDQINGGSDDDDSNDDSSDDED